MAAAVLLASCSGQVTEIIVEVHADDAVIAQIDHVRIAAARPMGEVQSADANLAEKPLPRSLTLVHQSGPLGPVEVEVAGLMGTAEVVTRVLRVSFVEGESLKLIVTLDAACVGTSCGAGSTCQGGGCRPAEVEPCEFEGGEQCRDAGVDTAVPDATPDVCGMPEICNDADDDCDSNVDEDFDLMTDVDHCGSCDRACPAAGAHVAGRMCVDGSCILGCDPGYADCNRDASDGCEVDTTTDMMHCGACGAFCPDPGTFHATDTVCTGGRCIVSCDVDWGDCDTDPSTGCEAHLTVDPANCGSCGAPCAMPLRCRDSLCE